MMRMVELWMFGRHYCTIKAFAVRIGDVLDVAIPFLPDATERKKDGFIEYGMNVSFNITRERDGFLVAEARA